MPRYANLPARDALVLEYLGDGNALDTNDGTKANLTSTNVSYASCPVGYQKQWGSFNGSSSKVTTPSDSKFNFAGTGGFEVHVSCNPNVVNSGILVHREDGASDLGGYNIYFDTGNVVGIRIRADNNSNASANADSTGFVGKNKLLRFRYDGTKLTVQDGLTVIVTTNTSLSVGATSSGLGIGSTFGGGGYFNGGIGTVRMFNRPLSDIEFQAYWHEYNRQLGGGSDFGAYIPQPSAYWDMNGDSCNVATGEMGTPASVTFGQPDHFGIMRAADFGSSSHIDVNFASNPITSGSYSYFSVFKTPASYSTERVLYTHSNSSNNANSQFSQAPDGKLQNVTWNGSSAKIISTAAALSTSTWYIAVMVANGGSSSLHYATLSSSITSSTGSLDAFVPGFDRCSIGYDRQNNNHPWEGSVSCFGIIPSALTSSQAAALISTLKIRYAYPFRRSLLPALQSKFLVWYPGIVSGTTVYDLSGNGNNGTVAGSPTVARLGQGNVIPFNGSSTSVSFPNLSGVYGVSVFAYPTAASKTIATISAGKTISLDGSYGLTSSGLTSPSYFVNDGVGQAGSSKRNLYTVGFSAETSSSGSFGTSSLTGQAGDLILWKEAPTKEAVAALYHSIYNP